MASPITPDALQQLAEQAYQLMRHPDAAHTIVQIATSGAYSYADGIAQALQVDAAQLADQIAQHWSATVGQLPLPGTPDCNGQVGSCWSKT